MSRDVTALQNLVLNAAESWPWKRGGAFGELKSRLHHQLDRHASKGSHDGVGAYFTLDLSDIHLNGLNEEVPCVVVAGASEPATQVVSDFWKATGSKDTIPFIFCLSAESHLAATRAVPNKNALIFSPSDVVGILSAEDSRPSLKQKLRQQLELNRLKPYNILRPAEGNMFFGRQDELDSLLWERGSSFALAGPSRIGKSSLLKRYEWDLRRRRAPRRDRVFLIDFYDCPDSSSDSVARHIACRMGQTWAFSRSAHHLPQLLKNRSQALGGPVELLLDEVDSVCFSRAFNYLAEAARNGHARLVLSGRGNLLNMMHNKESHLAQRLKLLQPEPLDAEAARSLITGPLRDLGFTIADENHLVAHILHMTGRLPGLLQYYGASIVDLASKQRTDTVTMRVIQRLEQQFETAERFLEPLGDLQDDDATELATRILGDNKIYYQPGDITRLARRVLKTAGANRVMEISHDLLIQGVLTWEDGRYRISNGAIRTYARNFELLQ